MLVANPGTFDNKHPTDQLQYAHSEHPEVYVRRKEVAMPDEETGYERLERRLLEISDDNRTSATEKMRAELALAELKRGGHSERGDVFQRTVNKINEILGN